MKIVKPRRFFRFHVIGFWLFYGACAAALPPGYELLIQSTKGDLSANQLAPAIEQVRRWHLADPDNKHLIYDLATLLDKAGDYPAAESYYQAIMHANAPSYAINAVAHAALKNQHFRKAEIGYELLISKNPDDMQAHVGLVYVWMGQQRIQPALDYVLQHLPKEPHRYSIKNVPLLIALAELYEAKQEWLQAAGLYQEIVQLNPNLRYPKRQLVFALTKAGAPYLAEHYANLYPLEFSEAEKYKLAHDDAALAIAFGKAQLASDIEPTRFNSIDKALAKNSAVGKQDITQLDRIVALSERGYMQETVELYRSLLEAKVTIPAYVKFAVAEAYLFLEQPEIARDLYLQGLNESNGNDPDTILDAQISLIYAYSEAGQYKEAEAQAERVLASQPRVMYKGMPGLERANPDHLRAYVVKAELEMNNDRLDLAEQHLQEVRSQAPFNNDVRSVWASLQVAREHPRAALDEYTLLQIDQPTLPDATIGRGETLLSLNEFAESKPLLTPLLERYPGSKAVHNYAERLANYDRPFYQIETVIGQGAVNNGADSLVDARLYSAPLTHVVNDHFRLFSHGIYAEGDTSEGTKASRSRLGVGLDYRSRHIDAEAEVTHTLNHPNSNGIALALGWHISDAWYAQTVLDTNTVNLPAAALDDDITAKELQLNLTWSKNESRKLGLGLLRMHFSDNNVRNMGNVWWMERWVSKPVFKLDSVLRLGASNNSEINRPYFNPERDQGVNVELNADWLNWRHYRRSFKQRLQLSAGQYWQHGFGSGQAAGIRYGHEWEFENEMVLEYGIGRNFQPYDGIREYRKYFYLNLSGRI